MAKIITVDAPISWRIFCEQVNSVSGAVEIKRLLTKDLMQAAPMADSQGCRELIMEYSMKILICTHFPRSNAGRPQPVRLPSQHRGLELTP